MRKRIISLAMCFVMALTLFMQPCIAKADAEKEENNSVVTIGADLTEEEKQLMMDYFGVKDSDIKTISVTNADERKYLEGVATDKEIGTKTFSCSYIQPAESGTGIKVKIANLYWVTSSMIASTLTTAGIYDCYVVCASPNKVSGTGALTGVMLAYEAVTGEELDESKKNLATEELVTTGTIAEELSSTIADEAVSKLDKPTEKEVEEAKEEAKEEADAAVSAIITEVKQEVITNNITNTEDITNVVNNVSNNYNITLNADQVNMISNVMVDVSKQEYDIEALESTFDSIKGNAAEKLGITLEDTVSNAKEEASGFFASVGDFFGGIGKAIGNFFKGIGNFFGGLFGKDKDSKDDKKDETDSDKTDSDETENDLGILENTNDSLLGEDAIIDSTDEEAITITATPAPESYEDNSSTAIPKESTEPTKEAEDTTQATAQATIVPETTAQATKTAE